MEDDKIEGATESDSAIPYYGEPVLAWEVDEYPRVERSRRWYVLASLVATALIIYAVVTANFLFAVIVLMIGVITLATSFSEPTRVEVIFTTLGMVVGSRFYEYRAIKDFSLAYNPPLVKNLYVTFTSPLTPFLSIPLEDTDPNEIREHLMAYCQENLDRTEESLTDRLQRMYKL